MLGLERECEQSPSGKRAGYPLQELEGHVLLPRRRKGRQQANMPPLPPPLAGLSGTWLSSGRRTGLWVGSCSRRVDWSPLGPALMRYRRLGAASPADAALPPLFAELPGWCPGPLLLSLIPATEQEGRTGWCPLDSAIRSSRKRKRRCQTRARAHLLVPPRASYGGAWTGRG